MPPSMQDSGYAILRLPEFVVRDYEQTQNRVAVVLDPDVASVFNNAESVNRFLRSVIRAMPEHQAQKKKAG
jgi:hypothetical protein